MNSGIRARDLVFPERDHGHDKGQRGHDLGARIAPMNGRVLRGQEVETSDVQQCGFETRHVGIPEDARLRLSSLVRPRLVQWDHHARVISQDAPGGKKQWLRPLAKAASWPPHSKTCGNGREARPSGFSLARRR